MPASPSPTPPVAARAVPEPAAASAPAPAPPEAPFEHKPKAPSDRVSLQLEDAELGELVRVMGEITGKRFVIASAKLAKVKASVYAPQKVTVAEAYQAFLAVLTANGLTVVPQAGFLKIVESADSARLLTPLERGELSPDERYVTRIHRLAHLSAEDVTTQVLSKLQTKDASIIPYPASNLLILTETSANMRRMLDVLAVLDAAGEDEKLWFRPLRHAPSTAVEKQLGVLLDLKKEGAAGGGPLRLTRIVALERPNAIVIAATKPSYDRLSSLVDLIDIAPSNTSQVHVYALQYADAKKIVGPLNDAVGSAASSASTRGPGAAAAATPAAPSFEQGLKIAADETSNSLIVSATDRDWTHLLDVIRSLDKPKRQVFIEAAILDITAEHGTQLGVAWHGGHVHDAAIGGKEQTTYGGFNAGKSMVPSADALQAFALGVRGPEIPFLPGVKGLEKIPSFGALLTALATQRGADILSTPSILASDNTAAEIKVQLQTSLQPNAPQVSPFPSVPGLPNVPVPAVPSAGVAANYRGIGPKVKVTPHLNDSDQVRLDVEEVISDIQNAPGQGDTFGTISYLERTATTTLTVKNGQTIVIGGLVRSRLARQESKVPVLGDLPLLGVLFRSRFNEVQKSNLVLVLTPHIIRDESDMRAIYERKMQERQELIDRESLFDDQEWVPPRDWRASVGLLAHVRAANLDVERRRAELAAREEESVPSTTVVPLDPPVPFGPSTAAQPSRPAASAAKPAAVEK